MSMDRTEIGVRGNTQLRRPVDDYIESDFYAPLTDSLITTRGRGSHTYTRATEAWSFDNEGKLNLNVPSGCARFTGARLVRNLIPVKSEDFSHVSWSMQGTASVTGTNQLNLPAANDGVYNTIAISGAYGKTFRGSVELSGSGSIVFALRTKGGSAAWITSDSAIINLTASPTRYTVIGTNSDVSTTGVDFWVRRLAGATATTVIADKAQLEDVSGQADKTAAEYVSVGVLSAPWHGAGVDGCKWFPTNKDGNAISASTLEGYLSEPTRTNNCLWGRDLIGYSSASDYSTHNWVNPQLSGAAELVSNGTFTTDTAGWTTYGGATISVDTGRLKIVTPGAASCGASTMITCVIGKTYSVSIEYTYNNASSLFGISISAGGQTLGRKALGTTSGTYKASFIATATTMYIDLYLSTGATAGQFSFFDNVSVKESAIQVTTTTGLDNVAKSASRLTAAANDATIMQLLTAVTGTRTLSAYIKRVSGSGTISLTRNGGIGWTDITSSLVTGSWVLVQMTSDVGANPTVGIKMGTSGDVIDVDCVQDENGAWATSPILTTTAAVTRNADVLNYASAFDVTQGTALCSLKTSIPTGGISGLIALAGDADARILRYQTETARTTGEAWDATNTATATGSSILTGIRKRATRWGSDLRMAADGALGSSVAFDGSMGASTTMFVGCGPASTFQISGTIREIHIWPTPLTDAQMQQVTK